MKFSDNLPVDFCIYVLKDTCLFNYSLLCHKRNYKDENKFIFNLCKDVSLQCPPHIYVNCRYRAFLLVVVVFVPSSRGKPHLSARPSILFVSK